MRCARLVPLLLVIMLVSLSTATAAAPSAALRWETHLPPPGTGVQSITYGNGRFVGVGGLAVVASEDGQLWRQVHQEPVIRIPGIGAFPGWMEPTLNVVAFGGGRFVAVGKPWFLVLASDDGEVWRYSYQWTGERMNGSRELFDVMYANGRFVAIGRESAAGLNSYVITSTDGVEWSQSEVFADVTLTDVTWDGARFLAVGRADNSTRGAVYSSEDGIAWRAEDADLQAVGSVVHNDGRFLALDRGREGDGIYLSADGAVWERRPLPVDFPVKKVAAAHGLFFLLGAGPVVAFSRDGEQWMTAETPREVETIYGAGGRLVAAGPKGIFSLQPCGRFIDLLGSDPSCESVEKLEAGQVINGYSDGSFRPGGVITRAEFAKILSVTMGWSPLPAVPPAFADTVGHWAADMGYLQAVAAARAIAGYPDGTFRPDAPVTRAELIQMVTGALGLVPGAPGEAYADVDATDWYGFAVGAGLEAGLIGPGATAPVWSGASFSPDRPVTRAEAAMVLRNLLDITR